MKIFLAAAKKKCIWDKQSKAEKKILDFQSGATNFILDLDSCPFL